MPKPGKDEKTDGCTGGRARRKGEASLFRFFRTESTSRNPTQSADRIRPDVSGIETPSQKADKLKAAPASLDETGSKQPNCPPCPPLVRFFRNKYPRSIARMRLPAQHIKILPFIFGGTVIPYS